MIGLGRRESRLACGENNAISGAFEYAEKYGFLPFSRQRCQRSQRLWKVLHRDDPQPVRVAPRLTRVRTGRHQEDVHTRAANAERLLLHAADRAHCAVRTELPGGRDLVAVGDVAPELLEEVEREREAGGGSADAARVDLDLDRQRHVERVAGGDADERPVRVLWVGDGLDRRRLDLAVTAVGDAHG